MPDEFVLRFPRSRSIPLPLSRCKAYFDRNECINTLDFKAFYNTVHVCVVCCCETFLHLHDVCGLETTVLL